MQREKILLVDDEPALLSYLEEVIAEEGYTAHKVTSAHEALAALEEEVYLLVITDLRMPELDGLELLRRIKERDQQLGVIVMTAFASLESAVDALRLGAMDYITKPLHVQEVQVVLRKAIESIDLKRENRRLRAKLSVESGEPKMIGNSSETQTMLELVRRVAPSDSTILITGESGTGKELIAQVLHFNSDRARGDFVTVNCAALPDTLLESELFGHRRGSFTGAVRDKEGLFKVANGGTLFLDEIGDMSPALQVKLLRALQEREILPIGATKPIKIDVRVIAATNADLDAKQQSGEFRPDLYYRLSVIPVHIKPLRDRREDIADLSEYFLERACKKLSVARRRFSPDAQMKLLKYSWPGNVRELENTIERLVILSDHEHIEVSHLPSRIAGAEQRGAVLSARMPATQTLDEMERSYLLQVLEETGWQKKRASEILGIDPSTIYRKLQRYGIRPPQ
ncbi:MAG: sigma-54-dependent Fis family transcriptional regulator [Calditrichaeota bacterium]|nr:sigma-54-dependent Fis family transcriptional regulator [Calditrichota bacterium]MCB9391033.1 sigma-54-dependent Fis family transcriptional regulator [Calditrichota bacterium]